MGAGASNGCSTRCNISYAAYFNPPVPGTNIDDSAEVITKQMVALMKQKNPNLKILLSFGGWNLDNLGDGCNYECDGDVDPLELLWNNYLGQPVSQEVFQCKDKTSSYPKNYPSDFCQQAGAETVATNLIHLIENLGVDGVDIDFENTKVYNLPLDDTKRTAFLQYTIDLTKELRKRKPDYIITHSPMLPYAIPTIQYFTNAYLFYKEVLTEVKDTVDFINVQFYNNDPEDSDPTKVDALQKAYGDVVTLMGNDASKVVFGMCAVKENAEVCTFCKTDKFPSTKLPDTAEFCFDSSRRLDQVIKPLTQTYPHFGGIMFWNTAGDENGVFSDPIKQYFQSITSRNRRHMVR